MGRKSHPAAGQPISLRIAEDLRAELASAAQSLRLPDHEVMRLSMQIGLKHFAAINYDIAGAVLNQSNLLSKPVSQSTGTSSIVKPPVASPSNITAITQHGRNPMEHHHIAADEPSDTTDIPTPNKVSYTSGKRRTSGA
jgi:hypothetical protein